MRFWKNLIIIATALLSSGIALGADVTVNEASSAATFYAVGKPGFLHINGVGAKVTGGCVSGACTFTSDLRQLSTGIDLRDEHMKDKYLEVGKYPTATLKVRQLDKTGDTEGELELHGVKKVVPIHAVITGNSVVATMKLKLTDFKLDIPTYMGVTVAEDVTVTASFSVEAKK